jgi:cytochrome c oxidase subunit 2
MQGGSVFNPNSSLAHPIWRLFWIVGIVMAVILLLVTTLVLYVCIRYRDKKNHVIPEQKYGHSALEIAWTIAPFLVLIFIFVATIHAMQGANPTPSPDQQPDLVIIAHQWWWEAHYPGANVTTANEIHIPVGKRFFVRLESADVIHDWWVAPLGPKMDAVPGHPNSFWLEADAAGHYLGTCAEYCGAEHAGMRILVIAQSNGEFEQWEAHQHEEASLVPTTGIAGQGAELFQQLTCSACHAIAGVSKNAQVGPDLTHVAGRETLAAGVIENTPENLKEWLTDAQTVKPSSNMPNFELKKKQVDELVAYLETLK